jgi:uncharacterized membrane protein (DUF2068 family)
VRLPHKTWHIEGLACALGKHHTPAADVAELRHQDNGLGIDLPDGKRLCRCLRCDAWHVRDAPAAPAADHLPPLDELDVPPRGKPLRTSLVLKLIAIDKAAHAIVFALAAILLLVIQLKYGVFHKAVRDLLNGVAGTEHPLLAKELRRLFNLSSGAITTLIAVALAYMVVEAVEAVGLWKEKRWAEYLTVVATSALVPLEVYELSKHVTVVRIGALIINLAIVIYLVVRKRLFGVRGGHAAELAEEHAELDHERLFGPHLAPPSPAPAR